MGSGPGPSNAVWRLTLIIALFFLWGAANNLNDILIKQFQKAFTLKDMQASLVQSAFYLGYFFGALPAARVAKGFGFKSATLVGLGLFALGTALFYPVSQLGTSYTGFLCCLYLIAFGLAFLESSANPWIVLLAEAESPGSGTRSLNFAQSFNPLGCISGILLGRFCILGGEELTAEEAARLPVDELLAYHRAGAAAVGLPYLALCGVVVTIGILFVLTPFPTSAGGEGSDPLTLKRLSASGSRLWRNPGFCHGLLAQFCYVGGQVCVWSFIIRLVQHSVPGLGEQRAADFILVSLGLFVAGRFAASALLRWVGECTLLGIFAVLASTTCLLVAVTSGRLCVAVACLSSFFMSMIFPTIFGLTLGTLDRSDTEVGSSLLVMAIVGGAVVTPVMGVVSDASSIATAYAVPGLCFLVVAAFAAQHGCGRFPTAPGGGGEDAEEVGERERLVCEERG